MSEVVALPKRIQTEFGFAALGEDGRWWLTPFLTLDERREWERVGNEFWATWWMVHAEQLLAA